MLKMAVYSALSWGVRSLNGIDPLSGWSNARSLYKGFGMYGLKIQPGPKCVDATGLLNSSLSAQIYALKLLSWISNILFDSNENDQALKLWL